jgi:hypothetical protein
VAHEKTGGWGAREEVEGSAVLGVHEPEEEAEKVDRDEDEDGQEEGHGGEEAGEGREREHTYFALDRGVGLKYDYIGSGVLLINSLLHRNRG